ncbi:Ebony activating protein [Mycena indigotica]|uniref:holo-[acyl-carrier-protein] synthase n=1 Tax=Mycena indigotica TaxID=2126181 RepID=A0A8H6SKL5_9AGAR|nr:Ebony activating protein [Mycena indigotica]KAF7301460.1 Ebony activating protein [Mycena indigotica]
MLLHARGVSLGAMEFSSTETGKPFITTQGIDPPIAFNVSHDNGLVVMASSTNSNIGIDVMKVSLPGRDTFISFVEAMGDQLTAHERQLVASALNQAQALEHFFWMWTAKEAYTKALGIGLGFNFRRVEFDPVNNILLVDGMVPKGWRFSKFVVIQGDERYQGVVAESVGGEETSILPETGPHEWLVVQKASNFIRDAVQKFEC